MPCYCEERLFIQIRNPPAGHLGHYGSLTIELRERRNDSHITHKSMYIFKRCAPELAP